jgi:hypothetical protein
VQRVGRRYLLVLPLVLVLALVGLGALLVVTRRRDWRIPALSASF